MRTLCADLQAEYDALDAFLVKPRRGGVEYTHARPRMAGARSDQSPGLDGSGHDTRRL
jgi:hypothetical protein